MRSVFIPLLLVLGCNSSDKASPAPAPTQPTLRQPAKTKRTLSAADWRADLAQLASELPKRHVNLFHTTSKQAFETAVAKLDAQLDKLGSHQIITRLTALVAMIQEGHTQLLRPTIEFLQLGLYWFSDGIHVLAAPRGHTWAIGRKLSAVNGVPVDQVIAKLTGLIARDNAISAKHMMRNYLIDATLLFGLGISKHKDRAVYTLADTAGKTRELTVALGQRLQSPPARPALPLYLQRNKLHYWNTYLAKSRTLYVQYNKCAETSFLPFKRFAAGVLKRLDKQDVDRLVIDLRHNGGGNSNVINPLLEGLAKRPHATKRGRLFVIIGRGTFSSAVLNTLALQQRFGAILVGEPSGGKPSHYGEVKTFRLSRSKLQVMHSTKFFRHAKQRGPSILPDRVAIGSHADYVAGIDPALAAVLAYKR